MALTLRVLAIAPLLLLLTCAGPGDSPVGPDQATLSGPSQQAMTPVLESVTGSGHYGDTWTTYSFHAIRRVDGSVDGHYQVRRHPLGRPGARQHGRIICFVVEGNQAWLGAIRENTAAVTNEGSWTGFSVVDNGEGGNAPADLIASLVRNTNDDRPAEDFAMAYCANKVLVEPQTLRPVEAGNVQIRR